MTFLQGKEKHCDSIACPAASLKQFQLIEHLNQLAYVIADPI